MKTELKAVLTELPQPLVGVTCLAMGADSLFAELVLEIGGRIEIILPYPQYESKLGLHDKERHDRLLERASKVTILEKKRSDEESYFEAGTQVVDRSDVLLAVWDGEPAKGLGGTGDIVHYALRSARDVIHLNPTKRFVAALK